MLVGVELQGITGEGVITPRFTVEITGEMLMKIGRLIAMQKGLVPDEADKELNNPSTSEDRKQALREIKDDYTKESELIKKSEENALKIKDAERAATMGIESNNKLGAIQGEMGYLTANGFNTEKTTET